MVSDMDPEIHHCLCKAKAWILLKVEGMKTITWKHDSM